MNQGNLNRKMKRSFFRKELLLSLFIVLFTLNNSFAQESLVSVVPYPQSVKVFKTKFNAEKKDISLNIYGITGKTNAIITDQLGDAFSHQYEASIRTDKRNRGRQIFIGLPETNSDLMKICKANNLIPDEKLGDEGYLLKIDERQIIIVSNSQAGAFYGVQTLRQMITADKEKAGLSSVLIKDWPNIGLRCLMDDISRGPIPDTEFIKEQIRRYSALKINQMSFYIENVVRTKKYPDFAPWNGGISVEEFAELSEYAKDYHVKLLGNFQSLGHFKKILSYPQYRHLGATERMLDPLNPESIEFLKDIYSEMAPAFSSEYFTPNCDEAWDLSRGKLKGAGDSLSVSKIYADHVNKIHASLKSLGKKTIVWGDIILDHPDILDMLSKDIIIGAWTYGAEESFSKYIDPIKNAGFEFTISPGVLNSSRVIPDFNMATTNIRNFINEGYQKGTKGVYCTIWDDGGMHAFSRDWYGVAYNAEQSWRPNFDELADYDQRFSRVFYGDENNAVPRALHEINKLSKLGPTYEMNMNVFWKTLIPERGDKVSFNINEWKEVKEIAQKSLEILNDNKSDLNFEDFDFIRFSINQYIFLAESRQQLLSAAEYYNQASALQLSDRSGGLDYLNMAMSEITKVKKQFDGLKTEFERLWKLENRDYWLDNGLLKYQKRQNDMLNQQFLLKQAISVYEKGGALPPPTELRLDIRRQSGQFFQFWLLCGSFPIEKFEDSSNDFLGNIGGEANVKPFPGMNFTDLSGKKFTWQKYDSPDLGEVNLKSIFEPHITTVAYAYCIINSDKKQKVEALLGSNDGATVYCNSKEVFHSHGKRSLIPDENSILLNLEEGQNHILIKVEQWKADWGFSFRLNNVEVRNHKQKYFIIN